MTTSSNGNIFHVTGPLCGEFTGEWWFPEEKPVTQCFDIFFDLRLNQQLSKQWRCWWFKMPWCSLWYHCNGSIGSLFLWWVSLQSSYGHYSQIWMWCSMGTQCFDNAKNSGKYWNGGDWLISLWTKWLPFCRRYFQMHFHEWKFYILIEISLDFLLDFKLP